MLQIVAVHRPQVNLRSAAEVRLAAEEVPLGLAVLGVMARVAVHRRVDFLAIDDLLLGIDEIKLLAENVDIGMITGQQECVAESRPTTGSYGVAVRDLVNFAVVDREVPAVRALPPLAVVLAADFTVKPDIGRYHPTGFGYPAFPGVDILERPIAVLVFMGEHVGAQSQVRSPEIERMVTDAVEILGTVGQHLVVDGHEIDELVASMRPVQYVKHPRHRIADPVVGRRLVHHRPLAAIPNAANNLVLGIVVGGGWIFVHVQPGEAFHAGAEGSVRRLGEALEHDAPHPFAGMEPVGLSDELLVVGAVFRQLGQGRFQLSVLLVVAFEPLLEKLQDFIGAAKGVEQGPVVVGLDGVVGAVERAPARSMQQIAAVIDVAVTEVKDGPGVGVKKSALHQRPAGGRHRSVNDNGILSRRRGQGDERDERGCKQGSIRRHGLDSPFGQL